MEMMRWLTRVSVCICLAGIPSSASGQEASPSEPIGGPLTGPPVLGAPFSAEATTTIIRTLDGRSRQHLTTTARYFRDSAGRVRVEQSPGATPRTLSERHIGITVDPDPGDGRVYSLDPVSQTVRQSPLVRMGWLAGGGRVFGVPIGGVRFLAFHRAQDLLAGATGAPVGEAIRDESLGRRRIGGVEAVGRRVTLTVPPWQFANDQPIEMIDERWESAELKLLIQSRIYDSRIGVIDYQVTNIRRAEPPLDLFMVPPDYTFDSTPTPDDPWLTLVPPERLAGTQGGPER
jgi:hypothetical protein